MVDSQLLLLKELQERKHRLTVQRQELAESRQFRERQAQPPLLVIPPNSPQPEFRPEQLQVMHLPEQPTVQQIPEAASEEIARLIGLQPPRT